MSEQNRFDWGETVRINKDAPGEFSPGSLGSVCGMRNSAEGVLYLIEFSTGEAIEILEDWLEEHSEEG